MHSVLLAFGFSWMIVAAVIGIVFGAKHDGHLERLDRLARQGDLAAYNAETQNYKAGSTTHGHSFLFSVIMVLVAVVVAGLPYPAAVKATIPYVLMCSTALWTVAALKVIRPLMILADAVFLLVIIVIAVGLIFNALA